MRKTMSRLTILLAAAALVGVFSMPALAIDGECYNCHTMHSSQDGDEREIRIYDQGIGTLYIAQPYLLVADCIGCHVGDGAEAGLMTNDFGAPIVLRTGTAPVGQGGGYTLAGGDFHWVAEGLGGNDTSGHNVAGINNPDSLIGLTPPGFDPGATPGALGVDDGVMNNGVQTWSTQLTCAGQNGCHGNHSDADPDAAIFGAHHSNTDLTATQADGAMTVGGSYRFLGGINGKEEQHWNWGETASTHNEYFGENDTSTRDQSNTAYNNLRTISYSCAQCHGFYHSQIDDSATLGSPWLRHPTDVDLPPTGEYQYYNPDGSNLYSVEAPVARPTPVYSGSNSTVTPGTDIVMCLSCHRAHGSPEPDLLRWDYDTMQAGTGTADTGCFTCHTEKNAD